MTLSTNAFITVIKKSYTNLALLGVLLSVVSASSLAANISVSVENLDAGKGKLYASLCTSEKFMVSRCDFEVVRKVSENTQTIMFNNVNTGDYAISVFYDKNENEKLDSTIFGIPKEPTGVSNNASAKNGSPKFDDAKFSVIDNDDLQLSIRVF